MPNPGRRKVLESIGLVSALLLPEVASAGEVGARINAAITKSDLGISVRRSVVRGAQIMDSFDGKWEGFSDKYGLGAARQKEIGRPKPKNIPDLKSLDSSVASKLLDSADECFLSSTKIDSKELQQQIRKVSETVAPSFSRAGLEKEDMELTVPRNAKQFNFIAYVHYKAYSDLIIDKKINFKAFKEDFESKLGASTLNILTSQSVSAHPSGSPEELRRALSAVTSQIETVSTRLVECGLVAQVDPAPIDQELLVDWSKDLADLEWSIALDGDATLGAQILLQEQGFRLYPSFGRCAIQSLLSKIRGQTAEVTDYYMDTDYNSDPDKFEVKEVLLNIVLESS